jgi:hypothetical protein
MKKKEEDLLWRELLANKRVEKHEEEVRVYVCMYVCYVCVSLPL